MLHFKSPRFGSTLPLNLIEVPPALWKKKKKNYSLVLTHTSHHRIESSCGHHWRQFQPPVTCFVNTRDISEQKLSSFSFLLVVRFLWKHCQKTSQGGKGKKEPRKTKLSERFTAFYTAITFSDVVFWRGFWHIGKSVPTNITKNETATAATSKAKWKKVIAKKILRIRVRSKRRRKKTRRWPCEGVFFNKNKERRRRRRRVYSK